jgi:hypothetical protein
MSAHFEGQSIALLTQHGKEAAIAPVLEPVLGCRVLRVDGFDTDTLGTFTRERPRPGSQLDAARRKARIGIERSGLPIGLASEGSFGPDPFSGLFTWNLELLLLIDDRLGIEVVGLAQGHATDGHRLTDDWDEICEFAQRAGFPAQQLVLRPGDADDPRIHKGIADWHALRSSFDACQALASSRKVFVETDLRAFANPSRMSRIREAAQDLLARLRSICPACGVPGFWPTERQPGLACSACGLPTRVYRAEIWNCCGCGHREVVGRKDLQQASPADCAYCNP